MHTKPHPFLALGHGRRHDGPDHEPSPLTSLGELTGERRTEGENGRGGRVVDLEQSRVGVELSQTQTEELNAMLEGLTDVFGLSFGEELVRCTDGR